MLISVHAGVARVDPSKMIAILQVGPDGFRRGPRLQSYPEPDKIIFLPMTANRPQIEDPALQPIAEKVFAGERLNFEEGVALFKSSDLLALGYLAHHVREKLHGKRTYFNVNPVPWTRAISGNYLDVRVAGRRPANEFLDVRTAGVKDNTLVGAAS